MAGYLTTHILDTAQGIPAPNVTIQLWKISGNEEHTLLKTIQTTSDGRTEQPLLAGEEFVEGNYELIFAVGKYFATQHISTARPPFLDLVPIRFTIADPLAHYHIPLLVSPWAYSTYRGN